ncbi:MAG: DNA repair protein RadC [Anaerolineales bacterium]
MLYQNSETYKRVCEAPAYAGNRDLLMALVPGPQSRREQAADAILRDHGTQLDRLDEADLAKIPGVGPAATAAILAAREFGRRMNHTEDVERPTVSAPAAAAALLQYEMGALEKEELRVILLDARNRLLRIVTVYKGSLTTSLIRTGEVFRDAIRWNAAGIIVAHNHPSGDSSPSPEDLALTRNLIEAGRLLDIPVLDHVVLGRGRFVSMRESGMGFTSS